MRKTLIFLLLLGTAIAQIHSVSISLHDAARNKNLPVTIVYGACAEKCPFIVFSHGAGGSPSGHAKLAAFWAEHGYIVALPQHNDSIALRRASGEANGNMLAVLAEIKDDADGWRNRVADAGLVVSSTPEIERSVPAIKGKIDTSRIGLGGHSYGAYTSQVAAGALITFPGDAKQTSLRNPLPKAFLMMSPQGPGQMGLTDASWKDMDRPFMVMTGTYDSLSLSGNNGPEWRKSPYSKAPAGDKFFAFFVNANHMSFTDRPSSGKGLFGRGRAGSEKEGEIIQQNVFLLSLLWWDAYLKGEPKAKQSLLSGEMERASAGAVKLEHK